MINLATVRSMRGDHDEAIRLLNEGFSVYEEIGDGMRICESLVTRSEVYRLKGDFAGALADADHAVSQAEAWGYRYVAAAAYRQRARALADLGKSEEAARAAVAADAAYARLGRASRDLLAEHFLADDDRSWRARQRAANSHEPSVPTTTARL